MSHKVAVAGAGDSEHQGGAEVLRAMFVGSPARTIRFTPRPVIDSIATAKVRHVFHRGDHKSRTFSALAMVRRSSRRRLKQHIRR